MTQYECNECGDHTKSCKIEFPDSENFMEQPRLCILDGKVGDANFKLVSA